jgi:hypothetical protein
MRKILIIILAAAMLLTLAACAKTPGADPTADPTPAAPAAYAGEDTFVISREGEDFVIGSAGLGVTVQEVCEAYGVELEIGADPINAVAAAVPPVGGDIRFGMSYAEVAERLTGVKQEREPSMTLSSRYVNSYAGALTRMRFQFDVESDRLYLMGLDFMTDDPAAEWYALLEKFTQAFGEPTTPPRGDYTTPEELTAHLSDGKHYAAAAWEGETKGLALMIRPHGSELSVSVEMKWLDLMPGFAAAQQG